MTTRARIRPGDGDPRHGTNNGYNNLGCRCSDCKAAHRIYESTPHRRAIHEKSDRKRGMVTWSAYVARVAANRKPCGTHAAYQRHRRYGEDPCQECRDGEARYQAGRRAGTAA